MRSTKYTLLQRHNAVVRKKQRRESKRKEKKEKCQKESTKHTMLRTHTTLWSQREKKKKE